MVDDSKMKRVTDDAQRAAETTDAAVDDARARRVVDLMMSRDAFSRWLGIEVEVVGIGRCVLSMTVRDEMVNGFGLAHGGIAYSLADSALAFASNGYGAIAVALTNTIWYPAKVSIGDRLVAEARELSRTRRTGLYEIRIHANGVDVAFFNGTVYITEKQHEA